MEQSKRTLDIGTANNKSMIITASKMNRAWVYELSSLSYNTSSIFYFIAIYEIRGVRDLSLLLAKFILFSTVVSLVDNGTGKESCLPRFPSVLFCW